MLGILDQILCWIKQFGALVLNALIDVCNLLIAGIGAAITALIAAWPVAMPTIPTMPSGLATAFGWIAWSPFPMEALGVFVALVIAVYVAMIVAGPLMRWLRLLG